MIEPEGGTEKETESASSDWMGALKFAGAIVVGLLAIVGFGWEDLLRTKPKTPKSNEEKETESTDEEAEGVADYEETYLEGSLEESDYENVPSK